MHHSHTCWDGEKCDVRVWGRGGGFSLLFPIINRCSLGYHHSNHAAGTSTTEARSASSRLPEDVQSIHFPG
jgi:hypothetical protein